MTLPKEKTPTTTEKLQTVDVPAKVTEVTPQMVLLNAYEKGADTDQLTNLLELQIKFEKREAEKAFNLALAEFKADAPKITKDKKVSYQTDKGVTEYSHASLGHVVDRVCAGLSKYGLSHSWTTEQESGLLKVTCIVRHKLGHEVSTTLMAAPDSSGGKNGIQSIGSAKTYLERYTLLGLLGLASEDDDDGQASGVTNQGKTEKKPAVTEDQAAEINDLIIENKIDTERFLGFFSSKAGYIIESVEDLPADAYDAAKKQIARSANKGGKK